jgi:6-phosphogluconolactonase
MNFRHFNATGAGAVISGVISAAAVIAASQMPDPVKTPGKDTFVYIGTHGPQGRDGIYLFRLQSAGTEVFQNVTLVPLGLVAETDRPSHFELDTTQRRLFTVNEIDQFEGKPTGSVSAYAIDPDGKLTPLNRRESMGTRPCHLALDSDGRHLLVANCGSGTLAVVPVGTDGQLGAPTQPIQVVRGGGSPEARDLVTCVVLDPANRFAFACDPRSDRILSYSFDAAGGTMVATPLASTALKSGARPRQMAFRQDGRFAYVLNEQTSTVTVFAYDSATGRLTDTQTISTLPEYFDGPNVAGELYIHRSGKWLYASNVGHNSVVLFTIHSDTGMLTFVEEQGTGGRTPRQFGIEPSSKHLAISNRDSNTVLASRIDEGNGRLKPSGIFADVPSPTAIRFLPPKGTVQ